MKNNLYVFRMKAVFSDKLTVVIMLLSALCFFFLINNLSLHAEERSSIPIGVVNLDRSESANELVENIKEVPAFFVYEGGESELKALLYKEEIRVYFIIKEGYEKSIQAGSTDKLIDMYYPKEDASAKLLSDIIAGEMLYKICLYKGYQSYQFLPRNNTGKNTSDPETREDNRLSEKEYADYAKSLEARPDFAFAFDISLVNINNGDFEGKIDNSVLYLQAVWGIIAMLLSFTAMLITAGSVLEKETGIQRRAKISLLRPYSMDFSHFGAAFTVQSILAFFLCYVLHGKTESLLKQDIQLFFLLELFSGVMILWFLFLGKLSERLGRYQLIGVISNLIFGLLGFLYLLEGFIDKNLLNISKIIPNCWFIEEFTDIILKTNLQGIPYISFIKFIIAACGLLILNGLISKRQNR